MMSTVVCPELPGDFNTGRVLERVRVAIDAISKEGSVDFQDLTRREIAQTKDWTREMDALVVKFSN